MNSAAAEDYRIPVVTTDQMREVDRLMIEKYGIQLVQMMENAGRNLAELVRRLLENSVLGKCVAVAVGKGNNGGGGMVAAHHLCNWGARVTVLLPPEASHGVSEAQRRIIEKLPIKMESGEEPLQFFSRWEGHMIIDSLIGYSLSGKPRGWIAEMIKVINASNIPIVALDVPSGLDATTGKIYHPCIQASATLTLALPKTGLMQPQARSVVGSLYLADIGVPDVLYKEIGIKVEPLFVHDTIVKLRDERELSS